jgi:hypothetical protein
MKALQLKDANPRLQKAKAQPFEHQVVCPTCHYLFPGGKDHGGADVPQPTEGEDHGVEWEIAGWAVVGLVVGDRAKVLVGQPGRVVVLLRSGGWVSGGELLQANGDRNGDLKVSEMTGMVSC